MVRETPQRFESPVTIAGADFGAARRHRRRDQPGRRRDRRVPARRPAGDRAHRLRLADLAGQVPARAHADAERDERQGGVDRRRRRARSSRGSARRKVEAARVDDDGIATKAQRVGTRARERRPDDRALADRRRRHRLAGRGRRDPRSCGAAPPGRFSLSLPVRLGAHDARVDGFSSAVDVRGPRVRRLARAARAGPQAATSRPRPSAASSGHPARLRQGPRRADAGRAAERRRGRLVALARRLAGAHRSRAAASSRAATTVSKPLDEHDQKVARAAALAGPGARVDLFWPQTTPDAPDVVGDSDLPELRPPGTGHCRPRATTELR